MDNFIRLHETGVNGLVRLRFQILPRHPFTLPGEDHNGEGSLPFRKRNCSPLDELLRLQVCEILTDMAVVSGVSKCRQIFNRDSTRFIWRSLMQDGLREATGSHVGKTIVFARGHDHAVHLAEVFSDLYPQHGSTFCRVIDRKEPKAEQLIDDFKNPDHELTIAISVDMLDTGIDVPEVVNLVFFKLVRSKTKFWQMLGRGTRLCPDLFGPGQHKELFFVFDYCQNLEYFSQSIPATDGSAAQSLGERLFNARLDLIASLDTPSQEALVSAIRESMRSSSALEQKPRTSASSCPFGVT